MSEGVSFRMIFMNSKKSSPAIKLPYNEPPARYPQDGIPEALTKRLALYPQVGAKEEKWLELSERV